MRKLFLAVALATTALGATAHAEGAGPYVTVEGGVVLHDKAKVYGPSDTFERLDRFKTGWEAGGALGYDFGGFRLEAEGFYNRAYLKSQDRAPSVIAPFGYVDGSNGLRGRTTTVAAMANALFSVGKVGGVKLYAGGGAGWARTSLKEDLPGADPVRGRSNGFAWQALAGLTAPISDHIDLGVKYRYFRPDNADKFYRGTGFEQTAKLRSHSVLATLTYNFGGPKVEPIEEPVAAPPPPPPPAVVCNTGPYIVFFDWNKSDVTAEAATILDNAVTAYGNCASVPIMVAGYADASGSKTYNVALSNRRADEVRGYLTSHGVTGSAITTKGFGEDNQRVPTADGVRELQNRRVEITYGPGAGM